MTRAIAIGVLAASLGIAPMQCGGGRSDPSVRTEDSAGDALWALAMDFRAKGNEDSAKQTLRFLVEHYPSNRHVPAAKLELEGSPGAPASPPPAGRDAAAK